MNLFGRNGMMMAAALLFAGAGMLGWSGCVAVVEEGTPFQSYRKNVEFDKQADRQLIQFMQQIGFKLNVQKIMAADATSFQFVGVGPREPISLQVNLIYSKTKRILIYDVSWKIEESRFLGFSKTSDDVKMEAKRANEKTCAYFESLGSTPVNVK